MTTTLATRFAQPETAAVAQLDDEIARRKRELTREIQNLRVRLLRTLEALAEDETVPALGVVQGAGADIDRLCGELRALEDVRAMLQRILCRK